MSLKPPSKVNYVELWYPRVEDAKFDGIEIELMDVRAANSIRVSYDFNRNGWVIWGDTYPIISAKDNMLTCDEGWTEVAFIPARFYDLDEECKKFEMKERGA